MRSARFGTVILGAAVTATLFGCGSPGSTDYPPMQAYGPSANVCYYAYSPAEVDNLEAQGLCAQGALAVQAPPVWLDRYWYYYDSPLYYDTFVPPMYRHYYATTYARNYQRQHSSDIARLAKTAVYRTTSGKKVTGVTSTARFGQGSSFGSAGQRYGSGNLRSRTVSPPSAHATVKGTPRIPGTSGFSAKPKKTSFSSGNLRRKSARSRKR